ncbi:VWA domain-containing protein, partial [Mediterraneibacter glycyrrhizinilyticus]
RKQDAGDNKIRVDDFVDHNVCCSGFGDVGGQICEQIFQVGVIVMFTDGKTTAGAPPAPVAAAARAAGIVIYCIGLVGADGID